MFSKTKLVIATALILGAASAALANDIETNPSEAQSAGEWAHYLGQKQKPQKAFAPRSYQSLDRSTVSASPIIRRGAKAAEQAHASTVPCPTLEGYPDCH
jgi:hypothetical protein